MVSKRPAGESALMERPNPWDAYFMDVMHLLMENNMDATQAILNGHKRVAQVDIQGKM